MVNGGINGSAYQRRRRDILATALVCGICGETECPHCHGSRCPGGLTHIDHKIPRSQGGTVTAGNEQASHQCCNLRKGASGKAPEILRTSRQW